MAVTGLKTNTSLSLSEFATWLGLQLHYFNGFNLSGNSCQDLQCIKEYAWNSKGFYARQDMREALRRAETLFVMQARRFPTATQVYEERHEYPIGQFGLLTKKLELKTIIPQYKCDEVQLGVARFRKVMEIDLAAQTSELTEYPLELEITITIDKSNLRSEEDLLQRLVILNNSTINPRPHTDSNLDLNNIRQYLVEVVKRENTTLVSEDDTTIVYSIKVNTAKLKSPSYDSITICLEPLDPDYFDDTFDLYEMYIDKCSQGYFILDKLDCSVTPCRKTRIPICGAFEKDGCGYSVSPEPIATCSYDEDTTEYSFTRRTNPIDGLIEEVELNYISGDPLAAFDIDAQIQDTIFKLALGISPLEKRWCICDYVSTQKWDYYTAPKKVDLGNGNSQLVLTDLDVQLANGYTPTRGLLEGMRDIVDYLECCPVEGMFL